MHPYIAKYWSILEAAFLSLFFACVIFSPKIFGRDKVEFVEDGKISINSGAYANMGDRNFEVSERSIEVDPKVYVSLKMCGGILKINGWERNEVRAFVTNGEEFEFKIVQRSSENLPNWIEIQASKDVGAREKSKAAGTCLEGKRIEIDIPRNASVRVDGTMENTEIDNVRAVEIVNSNGEISIKGVENGVRLKTYGGDVLVVNSAGTLDLVSASGDISVFGAKGNDPGDSLTTKTFDGDVTLQKIDHRDVKVNTLSGAIRYEGNINPSGKYVFGTQHGDISIGLNATSGCRIAATYGSEFYSELPIVELTKDRIGNLWTMRGTIGGGGCNLEFSTLGGSVHLQKLD